MKLIGWFITITGLAMSIVGFASGSMTDVLAVITGAFTGIGIVLLMISWYD